MIGVSMILRKGKVTAMDEEIEYTPPELHPRRRREHREHGGEESEKNGFWGVLTMQAIVCVIAVIVLVVSQTFFPKFYEQTKQTYQKSVTAPVEIPEELAAFAGQVVSFFTDPPKQKTPAGSSSGGNSSGGGTSSAASSGNTSSQTQSGGAASSQNAQSSQPSASSKPSASSGTSSVARNTTGIVKTSTGGGGGETSGQNKLPAEDTPLTPPANATFAPVLFTVKPGLPIQEATQSSGFGYRISPITGKLEFHKALDLAAPRGTPIYAAASGTVIHSEYSQSLGYYIAIQHSNGFVTRYGHCSELIAPKGAVIRQGEVIAKVGATGEATGNHLHFEMSKDGVVFDPAWLYDYD